MVTEGGVWSACTHRYLIVHTWVGLKRWNKDVHTEGEGGGERTGGNGRKWKEENLNLKDSGDKQKWRVNSKGNIRGWIMKCNLVVCGLADLQYESRPNGNHEGKTNTQEQRARKQSSSRGRVVEGECGWKVVLAGVKARHKKKKKMELHALNCSFNLNIRCKCIWIDLFFFNIPPNVFKILEKMTGMWNEELTLLPVNANNRAVCLRVRHHISRKELAVICASRGRTLAPQCHIKPPLPKDQRTGHSCCNTSLINSCQLGWNIIKPTLWVLWITHFCLFAFWAKLCVYKTYMGEQQNLQLHTTAPLKQRALLEWHHSDYSRSFFLGNWIFECLCCYLYSHWWQNPWTWCGACS